MTRAKAEEGWKRSGLDSHRWGHLSDLNGKPGATPMHSQAERRTRRLNQFFRAIHFRAPQIVKFAVGLRTNGTS
jgi:hypothetical protein